MISWVCYDSFWRISAFRKHKSQNAKVSRSPTTSPIQAAASSHPPGKSPLPLSDRVASGPPSRQRHSLNLKIHRPRTHSVLSYRFFNYSLKTTEGGMPPKASFGSVQAEKEILFITLLGDYLAKYSDLEPENTTFYLHCRQAERRGNGLNEIKSWAHTHHKCVHAGTHMFC